MKVWIWKSVFIRFYQNDTAYLYLNIILLFIFYVYLSFYYLIVNSFCKKIFARNLFKIYRYVSLYYHQHYIPIKIFAKYWLIKWVIQKYTKDLFHWTLPIQEYKLENNWLNTTIENNFLIKISIYMVQTTWFLSKT